MKTLSLRSGVVVLGFWAAALAAMGCNNTKTPAAGTLPEGAGYCEPTCAKTCTQDQDCDTSQGYLCCDYGAAGKACSMAAQCPIACTDDSRCDSSLGQACVRVDLSVTEKICTTPSSGIQLCAADTDCGTGDVCCTIYNEPICLPPTSCPKSCSTSDQCQTTLGEVCCTSVAAVEPALSVSGLCLNPNYNVCPKACAQSSDCATAGELCCNGICQTTCPKTCMESSDCDQQICCKSATVRLPPPTLTFTTGPHCAGTPYSCLECGELESCGTASGECPGCSIPAGGACSGTRAYSCSTYSISYMSYCAATPGCSWDATSLNCSGTPAACSTITTNASCSSQADCSWSSGTCAGTPTPCSQLAPSACSTQPGCSVVSTP